MQLKHANVFRDDIAAYRMDDLRHRHCFSVVLTFNLSDLMVLSMLNLLNLFQDKKFLEAVFTGILIIVIV